ncbi:MAG: hypothetical protein MHM6MM_009159 [Cercozoa sp. M6MM]
MLRVPGVASFAGRSLLSLQDVSRSELAALLTCARQLKLALREGDADTVRKAKRAAPLRGESIGMIFQKRSTRTRVSSETGMNLLGGHALFLGPNDIQLGENESLPDTARVLSRFNSLLLARVYSHDDVQQLAHLSSRPVINALSDLHHPLQTLADLQTLMEHYGVEDPEQLGKEGLNLTVAWVGDGNNVLHDLMLGCARLGINVRAACPTGYEPDDGIVQDTKFLAATDGGGSEVLLSTDVDAVVTGADVIVTDTWVSMGQEEEKKKRLADFAGYQVDTTMMQKASDRAVFLHCLPRKPVPIPLSVSI